MSLVRFSPDEQFLAVVAGGGTLVIWELRLSDGGVCKVRSVRVGRVVGVEREREVVIPFSVSMSLVC